jgi:hypothetical protein
MDLIDFDAYMRARSEVRRGLEPRANMAEAALARAAARVAARLAAEAQEAPCAR